MKFHEGSPRRGRLKWVKKAASKLNSSNENVSFSFIKSSSYGLPQN